MKIQDYYPDSLLVPVVIQANIHSSLGSINKAKWLVFK